MLVRYLLKPFDEVIKKIQEKFTKKFKKERSISLIRNLKPIEIQKRVWYTCMNSSYCQRCKEKDEEKLETHQRQYTNQRSKYKIQKKTNDKELFFVVDFGSYYPANSENKTTQKVSNLLFVQVVYNNEEKKNDYIYFYFISTCKQTYQVFEHCF